MSSLASAIHKALRPATGHSGAVRTSYTDDLRLIRTAGDRVAAVLAALVVVALPFLAPDDILNVLALAAAASIGAIGQNILTGYTGQVSLGHAFFLGVGAYVAAVIGGDPSSGAVAYGISFIPIWLLAAGLVAGLLGVLISPLAVRLRGLYLAVVTLGVVFLGLHVFKEAAAITGGVGVGRRPAVPELFGFRFDVSGEVVGGIVLSREQRMFYLVVACLALFAVAARNIVRSKLGRAFEAIRDRDIAAAVVGVNLSRFKLISFGVSSFFAGVSGALFYTVAGYIEPTSFNLLLSVQFIAMILIGGTATISGSILGAFFVISLGRMTQVLAGGLPFVGGVTGGGIINVFELEAFLYGGLIVGFLLVAPGGLVSMWTRARSYISAWPWSQEGA